MTNKDYYPDIEPFQYHNSAANPHQLHPTSTTLIGHNRYEANHQNDLFDIWNSAKAENMPPVSFLKSSTYQSGHPEISDAIEEEQHYQWYIKPRVEVVFDMPQTRH
jgi:phospholipase C